MQKAGKTTALMLRFIALGRVRTIRNEAILESIVMKRMKRDVAKIVSLFLYEEEKTRKDKGSRRKEVFKGKCLAVKGVPLLNT